VTAPGHVEVGVEFVMISADDRKTLASALAKRPAR